MNLAKINLISKQIACISKSCQLKHLMFTRLAASDTRVITLHHCSPDGGYRSLRSFNQLKNLNLNSVVNLRKYCDKRVKEDPDSVDFLFFMLALIIYPSVLISSKLLLLLLDLDKDTKEDPFSGTACIAYNSHHEGYHIYLLSKTVCCAFVDFVVKPVYLAIEDIAEREDEKEKKKEKELKNLQRQERIVENELKVRNMEQEIEKKTKEMTELRDEEQKEDKEIEKKRKEMKELRNEDQKKDDIKSVVKPVHLAIEDIAEREDE